MTAINEKGSNGNRNRSNQPKKKQTEATAIAAINQKEDPTKVT